MQKNLFKTTTLLTLIFLTGCGTTLKSQNISPEERKAEVEKQLEISLIDTEELKNRLFNIADGIFTASAPLCGDKITKSIGINYWNSSIFNGKWSKPAKNAFGLTPEVTLSRVTPNSAAAKANLQKGDVVLSIANQDIPKGKDGIKAIQTALKTHIEETPNAPLSLTYRRGEMVKSASFVLSDKCDYGVQYADDDVINAYADGKNIIINRGIIEFTRSDEELALIIGHELAHNALRHIDKKYAQASAGLFGGLLLDILIGNPGGNFAQLGRDIGALAFSPEYEAEADYMGLYAVVRAGYNIEKAPYFWRRMGARNTKAIAATTTHPPTAERFLALEKTVAEIKEKQVKNLPLEPDQKEETSQDGETTK